MLTVGSLEYQYGRVEEAMILFLELTTLPADTEDLPKIIDRYQVRFRPYLRLTDIQPLVSGQGVLVRPSSCHRVVWD